MPGQRATGQKLIPIPMSEEFIAEIDQAYRRAGSPNRASFIRAAVAEKLAAMGIRVPLEVSMPPARTGKRVSSGGLASVEELAAKAVDEVKRPGVVYGRKRKAGGTSGRASSGGEGGGEGRESRRGVRGQVPK